LVTLELPRAVAAAVGQFLQRGLNFPPRKSAIQRA
jgi:hypothetical protein